MIARKIEVVRIGFELVIFYSLSAEDGREGGIWGFNVEAVAVTMPEASVLIR